MTRADGSPQEELAKRAQALLDERQRALWQSTWGNPEHLAQLGTLGAEDNTREPDEGIRQRLDRLGDVWREGQSQRDAIGRLGVAGRAWFLESDWRGRNIRLFEIANEIQQRLD